MAYVPYSQQDEEEKDPNAPIQPLGAAPAATPAAGSTPGAAPNAPSASKFVGFDRLVNANRDASTAYGNDLYGQISKQGEAAQGAYNAATQKFDAAARAGTTYTPAQTSITAPYAPPAERSPLGFFINSAQDFHQQNLPAAAPATPQFAPASYSYSGPNSLSDVTDTAALGSQLSAAQERATLAGRPEGLQAMLGGSALDAALMGATNGEQLRGLGDRFGGFDKLIGQFDPNAARGAARTAVTPAPAPHLKQIDPEDYEELRRRPRGKLDYDNGSRY